MNNWDINQCSHNEKVALAIGSQTLPTSRQKGTKFRVSADFLRLCGYLFPCLRGYEVVRRPRAGTIKEKSSINEYCFKPFDHSQKICYLIFIN